MQALIVRAGVAPVSREPSLQSEQVTQLVLGETALVVDTVGDWCRVRCVFDGYEGWVHRGYVVATRTEEAIRWREGATGWSDGAVAEVGGTQVHLPVRARVRVDGEDVILPEGRRGRITAGRVLPEEVAFRGARRLSPERWATDIFSGTPYQWGGVTAWGVDCSGLVQTTFAARGVALPRDASQQVEVGAPVDPARAAPGDLLFFREGGDRVTHVAFAGPEETLIHSTLRCGGFVVEPWVPGTRASFLRERLVAVRRVADGGQLSAGRPE